MFFVIVLASIIFIMTDLTFTSPSNNYFLECPSSGSLTGSHKERWNRNRKLFSLIFVYAGLLFHYHRNSSGKQRLDVWCSILASTRKNEKVWSCWTDWFLRAVTVRVKLLTEYKNHCQ